MPNALSHRLRSARCSQPGRRYVLTATTHCRTPLFSDLNSARLIVEQLRQCDREGASRTLAWVVMPDHVQWLVELGEVTLARLMRRFKSRSSLMLRKAGVRHYPVWQAGYHDRALSSEDSVLRVARHIVANPVRAGLVERVGHYPHWDAVWL
ncbi:transposase [Pseudomonas sp. S75]|uniref:REP-associated tyrosine transposase n=1 Tax=unclassified Pseudomonas TaxID=196821 RepID=UPI00190412DA|nr:MULTISPECIES: transposase [unclassified Pseudomonas]MBJ9974671.1 transposase [Pseudomonas sp. S30]MBK0153450.1 transposase [Pseudomonas sp. S75]